MIGRISKLTLVRPRSIRTKERCRSKKQQKQQKQQREKRQREER